MVAAQRGMLRPLRTGFVAVVVFWGALAVFLVVTQMVTASIAASVAGEPSSCPGGELCDGTNLFGRDCHTLGFGGSGTLACCPDCSFDTSGCRR